MLIFIVKNDKEHRVRLGIPWIDVLYSGAKVEL